MNETQFTVIISNQENPQFQPTVTPPEKLQDR
jgi:hypothetical protein